MNRLNELAKKLLKNIEIEVDELGSKLASGRNI